MSGKSKRVMLRYYLYLIFVQMRFTRIIGILFITQKLNMNLVEFALLQSVFSFSQFFMEIPSGFLSDIFKKKTITIIGLSLTVAAHMIICSDLLMQFKAPIYLLIFAYVIEGFARAFISGSDEALFYERLKEEGDEHLYDKMLGRGQLISSLSVGAATFIGGLFFALNGKMPYYMQAAFSVIALLIIAFTREIKVMHVKTATKDESGGQLKIMFGQFKEVSKNSQMVFMVIFISYTFAIINTIFGIMPDYLNTLGFNSGQNGMIFMLLSFIGGLFAAQSYRLSKLSFGHLITFTCVLMGSSLLVLLIGGNKIIVFIGLTLFYVIIDILNPIAMKAFNSYVGNDIRATFLSIISFVTSAATMILYPITGYIVQKQSMETLLTITVVSTVFLLIIVYIIYIKFSKRKLG